MAAYLGMFYLLLLRSKHEFLDNDNLGVTFGNDEDRVILRPSHARIAAQRQFHPACCGMGWIPIVSSTYWTRASRCCLWRGEGRDRSGYSPAPNTRVRKT